MSATVLKFRRAKSETIRGIGRQIYSEALKSIQRPVGIVVVVIGDDGRFATKMAADKSISDFDVYSRAGALMDKARMSLLED